MSGLVKTKAASVKPERRFGRVLVFAFICMVLGALFYSAKTETLDNCRVLYGADAARGQGL